MPIEILELNVKATVDNTGEPSQTTRPNDSDNGEICISFEERARIVRDAVEEVLAILNRERDR
jgi:hypothetical protein